MTSKQSSLLVKSPHTKKAIEVLTKFAQLEAQIKELKKQEAEAKEVLLNAMIEHGIEKIEDDWGWIRVTEKVTYKQTGDVDEEFTKVALDSTKVKAHVTLKGELPDGVEEVRTKFINKRFI